VTVLHHGKTVYAGSLETMRADAPEPVWRLRTSDDTAAAAVEIEGIKTSIPNEGGLIVHAPRESLDAFVLRLVADKVAVRGLTIDATPLESLFFALTAERTP